MFDTISAKINQFKDFILAGLLSLIHYFYWGYEALGNDMIEIIPALKKLENSSLYPRDFYLNFTNSLFIHERSFILFFYKIIHASNPIILATLFGICLFFFCLGLLRIFRIFVSNDYFVYLGLICILIPIKYFSIGANELFYNMPVSGIYCKTLCIWALFFWLNEKHWQSYLLLIPASFFHVLAGFQVFILISLVELIISRQKLTSILKNVSIYLLFILPYLVFILISRKSPHSHDNSMVDLIEFRIGHHFFIQYSSTFSIIVSGILFSFAAYLSTKYSKKIFYFFIAQLTILLIYLLAVNGFRSEFALQLQWLKTTILLEFFSIILISKWISENPLFASKEIWVKYIAITSTVIIPIVIYIKKQNGNTTTNNEEIQLAEWTKKNTNTQSLFLYPPTFTKFKSISERSSWIDYKAISHQKAYLIPWYDRIHKVFNIELQDRRDKIDLIEKASKNYSQLSDSFITYLMKEQNINYVILPTRYQYSPEFKSVFSTNSYTIYNISSN